MHQTQFPNDNVYFGVNIEANRRPSQNNIIKQNIKQAKEAVHQKISPCPNKKHEMILLDSEAEFKRRGNFQLIFPFSAAKVSGGIYKNLYDDGQKPLNALQHERFQLKGFFL